MAGLFGKILTVEANEVSQNKEYDVGVFGVWYGNNYGSIATYYALNSLLSSLGKTVLMIDKPFMRENDIEFGDTHSRRFAQERYNISERYKVQDMYKLNDICSTFLVGSDQLWNYGISKGTGKTFYLDFAADEKKKIAFGTSFGHAVDFAPAEERKKIARFMARFDGISLREDDGVLICRKDYGINAVQVLDPVYIVDPSVYNPLIEKSEKGCNEPYLLAYILDPTPEKREAIVNTARELGNLKVICILDGLKEKFEKNKERMDLPNCIENVEVYDWLRYISEARFVITDSFHGASFSIIFQRDFIAICNKMRGYSRFQSLARQFSIQDHIVSEASEIKDKKTKKPVDYDHINQVLRRERTRSLAWLKDNLLGKKKSKSQLISQNVIGTVIPKEGGKTITSCLYMEMCTGCSACMSKCPMQAISIEKDRWGYYRSQINYELCIECGQCIQVCPALNSSNNTAFRKPECYEFISSDDEVLRNSSSGGVFTTLAKIVLEEKGIVVGAAWKDDFTVEHIIVENKKDLWKLQKSKYLQSFTGNCFADITDYLNKGIMVAFSGTPCQIAGLKLFLGKEYDNLILIDIFCSNTPSSDFFVKYIQDSFPEGIKKYEFRHKKPEWNWDCVTVYAESIDKIPIIHQGRAFDDYQRVFHNHTMCSKHCEKCKYQSLPRVGDISIGDFWGISRHDPDIDTKKGVSAVLCNTEKGKAFFDTVPENSFRVKKQVPFEWTGGNGYIKERHDYVPKSRDLFYKMILTEPFGKAVNYALKPNHGYYRSVYQKTNAMLQYDTNMLHFHFEKGVWQEVSIMGKTTLIVLEEKWREKGHYARLPLAGMLNQGKKYTFSIKFKIKSNSEWINFHIIDSGSKTLQIIHAERISGENTGEHWLTCNSVFIPNTNYYDEFMVGAAQISGLNNYLMIDYINISEV